MLKRIGWLWVVVALMAAGAGAWLARHVDRTGPALASGTWLPDPRPLKDFALVSSEGRPFTRRDLEGAPTLVFFGFTRCPDICPTTLALMARVKREASLPALRLAFFSIDPERDTPEATAAYVHAFDPAFVGVTGTPETIAPVAADFGVAYQRIEMPGGDYTMDHSAVIFLLDSHARRVAIFTAPFDAAKLAQDLKTAAPDLAD